jgi:hypothetical protein
MAERSDVYSNFWIEGFGGPLISTFTTMQKTMRLNWSAQTDTLQQVAASRRLLPAGGLKL